MNPYSELGLSPDASVSAVKRAYRRRARETHPDTGGSAKAFDQCKRAALVLLDPQKRTHFDRTGVIEEDAPDNALSEVLVAVSQLLDAAIVQCTQAGQQPESVALLDRMHGLAEQSKRGMAQSRANIEKHLKISERLVGRFKAKKRGEGNRLAALLEQRIAAQRANIAKLAHDEDTMKRTLEFLEDYSFEAERAGPENASLGQWRGMSLGMLGI